MPNYSEWQRRAIKAEAEVQRLRELINDNSLEHPGPINGGSLEQQCNCPMCEAQGPTSEGRNHA